LLEEAMAFFGRDYPRDRNIRISMLDAYAAQDPTPFEHYLHGWDPFRNLDGPFFDALENDHGGFARQADAYARDLAR
ncbi:MAG TPA: hypothetical protein VFE37_04500, partial [Chloroflexota bacterium]|nr:hypothetical protein [Chloroflexota bacterium]